MTFTFSFRGTIYLAYQHSAQEEQDKKKIDDFEIYGHKFEQYMTGGMDSYFVSDVFSF